MSPAPRTPTVEIDVIYEGKSVDPGDVAGKLLARPGWGQKAEVIEVVQVVEVIEECRERVPAQRAVTA